MASKVSHALTVIIRQLFPVGCMNIVSVVSLSIVYSSLLNETLGGGGEKTNSG